VISLSLLKVERRQDSFLPAAGQLKSATYYYSADGGFVPVLSGVFMTFKKTVAGGDYLYIFDVR